MNDDDWTLPAVVVAIGIVVARAAWWLAWWHPLLTATLAASGTLAVAVGSTVAGLVWLGGAALVVLWWCNWPVSFHRYPGRWLRSGWRREWVYHRRWRHAMFLSGLGTRLDGSEVFARLGRVRSDRYSDLVQVRLAIGQELSDWERRAERLAQSFKAKDCHLVDVSPGWVTLRFRTRDPLEAVVAPLPVVPAGELDLEAVPVGVTEDGDTWTVRLAGTHVLIGGCMGSGKSSVIWSLLHSLADAIHQGLVEVWAVDPKGGMELIDGAPMYRRYAYPQLVDGDVTPESMVAMVELVEDAARLMLRRADRMRGHTRKHTPTRTDPAVILVIDELATFTNYLPDDPRLNLRRRFALAIGVLLSQGRAPGVTVVGAIQDVRKEAIPQRDLIPTRVAMRMAEASQTDLVLGSGAHERGALCERIPEDLPGVGYVQLDRRREPTRVRAAWLDDPDVRDLAARYPAPPLAEVIDVTATDHPTDPDPDDVQDVQGVVA